MIILSHDIAFGNVDQGIIWETGSQHIEENAGEYEINDYGYDVTDRSIRRVNEWLSRYMDEVPLHRLCYDPSITTKHINEHLAENGTEAALAIDPYHAMTPLHMLSMNPHAPADTIAALLDVNMEVAFCLDNQGKMSMDYAAREYNVGGLVGMINGLCNHRHSC